jgi:hypothetical protein
MELRLEGIGMIDPKILEEFEKYLDELIGTSFKEAFLALRKERVARYVISLSKKHNSCNLIYWLEIRACAWQILHGDLVAFSYWLDAKEREKAHEYLKSLEGDLVTSVHFDLNELSLLIRFDTDYAIKLLHSEENSWNYMFIETDYGNAYEIHTNKIVHSGVDITHHQ